MREQVQVNGLDSPADVLKGIAWILSPTEDPRACPLFQTGTLKTSKRPCIGALVVVAVVDVVDANPLIIAIGRFITMAFRTQYSR